MCLPESVRIRPNPDRLQHDLLGDPARESHVDPGVDQRFHHQEDVRRACSESAVAMSTYFSSSTQSSSPSAREHVRTRRRWSSVTSGVVLQTLIPWPTWAGVFGMTRATACDRDRRPDVRSCAPAMTDTTTCRGESEPAKLAHDRPKHLRFDRQDRRGPRTGRPPVVLPW